MKKFYEHCMTYPYSHPWHIPIPTHLSNANCSFLQLQVLRASNVMSKLCGSQEKATHMHSTGQEAVHTNTEWRISRLLAQED